MLVMAAALCAQAPAAGTVEGNVADAFSGKPLAGARIKLTTQRDGDQHFTAADKRGRFRFAGIDLQFHYLTAEYPGYMNPGDTPQAEYPSARVMLSADKTREILLVRLRPYAVLSGRVTDAAGAPAEKIAVHLLVRQPMPQAGRPFILPKIAIGADELLSESEVRTDDRGEYRLPRLLPGTYYLMAGSGRLSGDKAYRDTFYPGEIYATKAREIAIDRAGEFRNFDIPLVRRVGVRVSGRVSVETTGQPVSSSASVVLWPEAAPQAYLGASAAPDYTIEDVLPGTYVLESSIRDLSQGLTNPVIPFAARRTLEVGERDIEGLDIGLRPTGDIPGTLAFERGCPEGPLTLYDWTYSRIVVTTNNSVYLSGSGKFVLRSLIPGTHRLSVSGSGPGPLYRIGSARLSGVEVGDRFEMPGASGPLDITVICSPIGGRQ
jgi:hypothetical protein